MGMYDDICFEYRMPDGYESHGFQTKDLECTGDVYEVTPAGRFVRAFSSGWPDGGRPLGDMNYCGTLNIYDSDVRRQWHEYDLEFVDGCLVSIYCHQTHGRLLFDTPVAMLGEASLAGKAGHDLAK